MTPVGRRAPTWTISLRQERLAIPGYTPVHMLMPVLHPGICAASCSSCSFLSSTKRASSGHCHCGSCRRHTGAPMVTFVAFNKEQVRFTRGQRKFYESSPGIKRAFCGNCGTPMTWEAPSPWVPGTYTIEFHISTFDNPEVFSPERHVFHDERITWFDAADELPRYRGHEEEPYLHGPAK